MMLTYVWVEGIMIIIMIIIMTISKKADLLKN